MPWRMFCQLPLEQAGGACGATPVASFCNFVQWIIHNPWTVVMGLIAGAVVSFWAGCPEGVKIILGVCLFLFFVDAASGVACAWSGKSKKVHKHYSSECFASSLWKFVTYAIVILTCAALDTGFRTGAMLTGALATLIMVREASSIIENTGRLGFNWPAPVVKAFAALETQLESSAGNAVPNAASMGVAKIADSDGGAGNAGEGGGDVGNGTNT